MICSNGLKCFDVGRVFLYFRDGKDAWLTFY